MVVGERCDDLLEDIVRLDFTFRPGADLAQVHGRVPNEGALMRAVYRCKAELLLADAEAMRSGAYRPREHDQRHQDAAVLALMRFTSAISSRGPGPADRSAPRRVPTRKRKRRQSGRGR
jgi:hypothetical protein